MMVLNPVSRALAIGVAVLLSAGCAGSSLSVGTLPRAGWSFRQGAILGKSWMHPEAKQETLLYISTDADGIFVFDYPSRRVVGELTDAISPWGLCSDAAGNVFVSDSEGQQVLEYAHGGSSPIRTLRGAAGPIDCAADPKTGNLAVASATAEIYIFRKEKGRPKRVVDPGANFWFCTYDPQGNLFATDDSTYYDEPFISELARGSSAFTNFRLSKRIGKRFGLTGIQTRNGYLAVADFTDNNIFQIRISNSIAKVVRKTPLVGAKEARQFTFYDRELISPDPDSDFAGIWNYPAGGEPVHKIDGIPGEPLGSTISEP
ncbi:MAG TPA: hypothetical protein VKR56_11920 [Candidatus Cybelea sp.]|nr:hypothetical protein [Candidatus Cybelea sp.]